MEFKVFMQAVEENLARISSEEELRDWIRGYARSLSEGERENFLKKLGSRERKSHQDKLQEIIDWCEKVDEEEITLSCYGYESYEYGGWGSDWIMKYEDPYEIGRKLEAYYEEAEQAVGPDGVVIIDSFSHAWEGEGGVLDFKELTEQQQGKNSFTAWSDAGKKQNTLINTLLSLNAHVIVTMRTKMAMNF